VCEECVMGGKEGVVESDIGGVRRMLCTVVRMRWCLDRGRGCYGG
jgi:hypothetical protein